MFSNIKYWSVPQYECLSHQVKILNDDPRQIKVEVVDINNPISTSCPPLLLAE